MLKKRLLLSSLLLLSLGANKAYGDFTIHEEKFLPGTWSTGIYGGTNVSSFTLSREIGTGVTGDTQVNTISGVGPYTFDVFAFKNDVQYVPSPSANVLQIQWENWVKVPSITQFASFRLAAKQGGNMYLANSTYYEPPSFTNNWQRASGVLSPNGFSQFGGTPGTPINLSSGDPISFGYFLSKGIFQTSPTSFRNSFYDVKLVTSSSVPEPSTLVIIAPLAFAFLMLPKKFFTFVHLRRV